MFLMPPNPVVIPRKKHRSRKRRTSSPPARSARLYVTINPSQVHLFRYLLEASDNMGIMTVVDRWRAALLIRYSPHQDRHIREWLKDMKLTVPFEGPFTVLTRAAGACPHSREG